jgi:hypothetical protein
MSTKLALKIWQFAAVPVYFRHAFCELTLLWIVVAYWLFPLMFRLLDTETVCPCTNVIVLAAVGLTTTRLPQDILYAPANVAFPVIVIVPETVSVTPESVNVPIPRLILPADTVYPPAIVAPLAVTVSAPLMVKLFGKVSPALIVKAPIVPRYAPEIVVFAWTDIVPEQVNVDNRVTVPPVPPTCKLSHVIPAVFMVEPGAHSIVWVGVMIPAV